MKQKIISILALLVFLFTSCDESTINPDDDRDKIYPVTDIELLTNNLWERKFNVTFKANSGLDTTVVRTQRLEFNQGLLQKSYFFYLLFPDDNFYITDEGTWELKDDSLVVRRTSGVIDPSYVKIIKLDKDSLIVKTTLYYSSIFSGSLFDSSSVLRYYKVN